LRKSITRMISFYGQAETYSVRETTMSDNIIIQLCGITANEEYRN